MRAGRALTKVVPSGNTERAFVFVTELLEGGDVFTARHVAWASRENVDHGLRRETRHRRAADVIEPDLQAIARVLDSLGFRRELEWPRVVVRYESNTRRRHLPRRVVASQKISQNRSRRLVDQAVVSQDVAATPAQS